MYCWRNRLLKRFCCWLKFSFNVRDCFFNVLSVVLFLFCFWLISRSFLLAVLMAVSESFSASAASLCAAWLLSSSFFSASIFSCKSLRSSFAASIFLAAKLLILVTHKQRINSHLSI